MKLVSGALRLSPTDLANYAACAHLTTLDLRLARGEVKAPDDLALITEALRRRGAEHERAYIECLAASGLSIADLGAVSTSENCSTIGRGPAARPNRPLE